MSKVWMVSCLTMLSLAVMGQTNTTAEAPFKPPPYEILRFNEDYSYLTNPADHTDLFDPIKYIPLRPGEPDWYLTFGGEVRERFESYDPQNFGIGIGDDSHLLQRITLLSDAHLGDRVRFFAEGISGIIEGQAGPAPPAQQDPLDLAFAFVDVVPYLTDDASLTLRGGRFELSLGSERLVGTRGGPNSPNIPFRFDGFEMLYTNPLCAVTGFATQPAKDSGGINSEDHTTSFWGVYVTHWFDPPHRYGIDLYYLGLHRDDGTYASGTANELRHTLGTRQFGQWDHWDVDAEEALQVGSFGSNSILAWSPTVNTGYTLDAAGKPRFGLKCSVISGSTSLHGQQETFNALFPNPTYFNDAQNIGPANLITVHPNINVQLTQKVSVNGGAEAFWRYSRNDAVYFPPPPGTIVFPALTNAPNYVMTAVDLNLVWPVQRHILFMASYVHYFTGSYVQAAGGRDQDFVSATFDFRF